MMTWQTMSFEARSEAVRLACQRGETLKDFCRMLSAPSVTVRALASHQGISFRDDTPTAYPWRRYRLGDAFAPTVRDAALLFMELGLEAPAYDLGLIADELDRRRAMLIEAGLFDQLEPTDRRLLEDLAQDAGRDPRELAVDIVRDVVRDDALAHGLPLDPSNGEGATVA